MPAAFAWAMTSATGRSAGRERMNWVRAERGRGMDSDPTGFWRDEGGGLRSGPWRLPNGDVDAPDFHGDGAAALLVPSPIDGDRRRPRRDARQHRDVVEAVAVGDGRRVHVRRLDEEVRLSGARSQEALNRLVAAEMRVVVGNVDGAQPAVRRGWTCVGYRRERPSGCRHTSEIGPARRAFPGGRRRLAGAVRPLKTPEGAAAPRSSPPRRDRDGSRLRARRGTPFEQSPRARG